MLLLLPLQKWKKFLSVFWNEKMSTRKLRRRKEQISHNGNNFLCFLCFYASFLLFFLLFFGWEDRKRKHFQKKKMREKSRRWATNKRGKLIKKNPYGLRYRLIVIRVAVTNAIKWKFSSKEQKKKRKKTFASMRQFLIFSITLFLSFLPYHRLSLPSILAAVLLFLLRLVFANFSSPAVAMKHCRCFLYSW